MKPLASLSSKGLRRRRKQLLTMPINAKRAGQLNQIDALLRAKLVCEQPVPQIKPHRPMALKAFQEALIRHSGQPLQ